MEYPEFDAVIKYYINFEGKVCRKRGKKIWCHGRIEEGF